MNISCDVIRDLLPLYHDGVCNESSKKLVEEHLAECGACRHMLEKIRNSTVDRQLKRERDDVVGHHKQIMKRKSLFWGIGIAVITLTLLLLADFIHSGDDWFPVMIIPALYGLLMALFLVNRYVKANAFTRAGLCVILGSFGLVMIEILFHWIMEGALRLRFLNANLFAWNDYVTLNANIDLLLLLTCCIVGGVLLGIGLLRKKRS